VGRATAAIDLPADTFNAGTCGYIDGNETCGNTLTPSTTDTFYQCQVCGTTWDVRRRQRDAISAAWNAVAAPPTIIRALSQWGLKVKSKDFENWVTRGYLTPAGVVEGRKHYLMLDVFDVSERMAKRRKTA
jgi:hypothetical protein